MAYYKEIVDVIDDAIVAGALTDSRFQNRAFAGLCFLVPCKINDTNVSAMIPAKVSTVGECNFIVPDDTFNLVTYHRVLSTIYRPSISQYGDGTDYIDATADMVLTVISFTDKLRIQPENVEALFISGFPTSFSSALKKSLQLRSLNAIITASSFDQVAIFNSEYRGETYFLKPGTVIFQIRYQIIQSFKKDCFTICCEAEA